MFINIYLFKIKSYTLTYNSHTYILLKDVVAIIVIVMRYSDFDSWMLESVMIHECTDQFWCTHIYTHIYKGKKERSTHDVLFLTVFACRWWRICFNAPVFFFWQKLSTFLPKLFPHMEIYIYMYFLTLTRVMSYLYIN